LELWEGKTQKGDSVSVWKRKRRVTEGNSKEKRKRKDKGERIPYLRRGSGLL